MAGLILLTGSEGRIGRHLKEVLPARGYRLRGLDMRPGTAAAADQRVVDLADVAAVRDAMDGVDAVVHAAAIPRDQGDGSDVLATNVVGTWSVLRAAVDHGVERVVCFSSINAQGSVGGFRSTEYLPIDDAYPHHPMSPYQLSKHLVEEMCRMVSARHELVTLCLRPAWVTDPEQYDSAGFGTDAFVERWRRDLWAYVDIRDVGDAVVRCLEVKGARHDRMLLAAADTSAHVETRALVDRELPGVPWPGVDPDVWLSTDSYRSLVDCSRARAVLGWHPRHSWRDSGVFGT